MELTVNEPFFNEEWMLKKFLNFNDEDLRIMEEQIRDERIMKERISKLNKIINELGKK